ncbi:hypothetical protein [Tateyamaria sp. SN6-1]|uniref:hypothetical protein n=1 Tax=Tateyamaria sp. SN6-1 TaxID=3092148 RepID=UPI0039F590DC
MRRTWAALPVALTLAACGDPLAGIERVSELPEPPAEDGAAAALPTENDVTADTPIFAGLFRREARQPQPDPAIEAALREANGVDEVISDEAPDTSAPTAPQAAPDATTAQEAAVATDVAPPPARGGVIGWLRRAATNQEAAGASPADAAVVVATQDSAAETLVADPDKVETVLADVELASLEQPVLEAEPQKRRGLFGLGGARAPSTAQAARPRSGPDARDVPLGTALPFGEIARVCEAKPRDMGEISAKAARKGRGYVLYDSAPGSASARTFYITGFADNCPRQFTAAIALFGEPVLHEQLRYGLPARDFPYSATDEAYEKVKAQVCNVGRTKPCGSRISRLDKTTTFVTAYENFGENPRWADMLLHDGEVLAAALKKP